MLQRRARPALALAFAATLTACGTAGDDEAGAADDRGFCATNADCASTDTCFDGRCIFQGQPPPEPPPEDPGTPEIETPLAPDSHPAATRRFVWITSPATDTVARIDPTTLTIDLIETGDDPIAIAALPDADPEAAPETDTVIVLARGSDEIHRITHHDGCDTLETWRLDHHHNALALSPDGRFALTWLDLDRALPGEDKSALQNIAVLDLTTDTLTGAAVGYRPRRVTFAAGRALITTEDGISIIDPATLDGGPAPLIPVALGLTGGPDREIAITPDGQWAASRDPAEPGITITHLAEGIPRFVPLGAIPTDLDLLPDGRTALVMLRPTRRLALVPLDAQDPIRYIELPHAPLGAAAIGANGRRALLYTTTDPPGAPTTTPSA